ncbi:dephospho-CoA kinase [Wenyingzhuangia sp. 2_MG-2023]|uniref:dephospho-CoA kinase n=1 Tax=Wenyingzhuangia sp. 2_MG-2023 TaxID=3062639 RepID=UPI0026E372D5|nr:dephospho-CoA kinase [Wenyingzhuangia sp. 2_MG-2023]MDO6739143.1 dephospho-CoA kinase [Wenyingzhuangia sp. 2_MG-2023]
MVVGLTGGIGSGKSTVLTEFEKLGVPTYIADVEAKKIMNSSEEVKSQIKALLGEKAYLNDVLNRGYIAEKVFSDKKLLKQLNAIVHPAVRKHFQDFIKMQTTPYLVYESAILFENNTDVLCDKIVVVTADLEERISRVIKRDGVSRASVLERMNNQWSQEDKVKKADFIIQNNHVEQLESQVLQLHKQLQTYSL